MSHVVASTGTITDLDCLEETLKKFFPKMRLVRDKKRFNWYGRWMNDYAAKDAAYKMGIDVNDYGKCEHAVVMDGVDYQIGLMKCKDKEGNTKPGWVMVWDFFGCGLEITQYIGAGAEKLMLEYGKEYANRYAAHVNGLLSMERVETDEGMETVIEIEVNV